eukprot:scaffold66462_cov32-Tisochrysis_lutea.AAC.4
MATSASKTGEDSLLQCTTAFISCGSGSANSAEKATLITSVAGNCHASWCDMRASFHSTAAPFSAQSGQMAPDAFISSASAGHTPGLISVVGAVVGETTTRAARISPEATEEASSFQSHSDPFWI